MTRAYRLQRALVVTPDGTYLGSGQQLQPGEAQKALLLDLPALLAGAARLTGGGEGVVLISTSVPEMQAVQDEQARDTAERIAALPPVDPALPAPPPDTRTMVGNSYTGRWRYTELRPWTTFAPVDKNRPVIHIGFLPSIDPGRSPLFHPHDDPAVIAHVLDRWHALTGSPWHGTGGITGCTAMRNRYSKPGKGQQPMWVAPLPRGLKGVGPLIWSRPLDAQTGYVHFYDINMQYLAALKNLRVAWNNLANTGAAPYDPAELVAGFWEVRAGDLPDWVHSTSSGRPPIIPARLIDRDGLATVSAATMNYLCVSHGLNPEITNSWTCANTELLFRPYAERLIAVRLGMVGEATEPIKNGVKRVYTETVGMIGSDGGRISRRDWQIGTMDLARTNLHRRLDKIEQTVPGLWPVSVYVDEVAYWSESADHRALDNVIGLGTGAGTFKYVKTLTVDEYQRSKSPAKNK